MKPIVYFFIAFFTNLFILVDMYSQTPSPGGVSGQVMWCKINPLGTDKQGDYSFEDCSDKQSKIKTVYLKNDKLVEKAGWLENRSDIITSNFNPLFPIKEIDSRLATKINLGKINLSSFTSFGVFYSKDDQFANNGVVYQINRGDRDYLSIDKNSLRYYGQNNAIVSEKEYGEEIGANLSNFKAKLKSNLGILCHSKASCPSKRTVWGIPLKETQILIAPNTKKLSDKGYAGKYIKEAIDKPADIYCSEFLLYSRFLSAIERKCVESYLAIKYGLSLTSSYIVNPKSLQLLWDYDEDKEYSHRITGFMVDSSLLINQNKALTRTEDFDNMQGYHDSFYRSDSYNEASEFSQLCIGRENANPLKEGYFLFGDNNKPLEFHKSKSYIGLNILDRKWLARCKLDTITKQSDEEIWSITPKGSSPEDNIVVLFRDGLYHFISTNNDENHKNSSLPLKGFDGYYSVRFKGDPFLLGYYSTPSINYTYRINSDGSISPFIAEQELDPITIEQGGTTSVLRLKRGDLFEIIKSKSEIYIRVNSQYISSSRITIPKVAQNAEFKGHVAFFHSGSTEVFCGGFLNNGNKVELSDSNLREMRKAKMLENVYLILDPSGKGDFNSENLIFIPASGYDIARKKIIFHNVFFDSDKNGRDSFTFGYKTSEYMVRVSSNVDCEKETGTISLKIIRTKLLPPNEPNRFCAYDLRVKGSEYSTQRGFLCDSTAIEHLPLGDYELRLEPKMDIGNYISLSSTLIWEFGSISWRHKNGDYSSFIVRPNVQRSRQRSRMNNPGQGARGVEISNNYLMAIFDSPIYESRRKLKDGDIIKLELEQNGVTYYVNNKAIWGMWLSFTPTFSTKDTETNFEVVYLRQGTSKIENLSIYGFGEWRAYFPEPLQNDPINISLQCDGVRSLSAFDTKPKPREHTLELNTKRFYVYQKANQQDCEAVLALNPEDGLAEIIVFNTVGQSVFKTKMRVSQREQRAVLPLKIPGIYIVKALTNDQEFTQKILVR